MPLGTPVEPDPGQDNGGSDRSLDEASQAMIHAEASRIRLKRAYETPEPGDGTRILIDRLWPRGVKKSDVKIDRWLRDIAPTAALRRWFGHRRERWPEFRRRYLAELQRQPELVEEILDAARDNPITLVYAARDEAHNDAVVLRELLTGESAKS